MSNLIFWSQLSWSTKNTLIKKKKNFKDKINLAYHKGLEIGLYKKNII